MKDTNIKKGKVFLDFYADWCGPCRTMEPMVDEFKEIAKSENIDVIKIDVDRNSELAREYSIRSIPCFIYLEDGQVIKKGLGTKTLNQLKEICNI